MRRRLLLLGLSLGLLLSACPVLAAEAPLRVMLNDVAPYSWHQGALLQGMHPAVMRALSEESGIAFEYSTGLYARVTKALTDQVADVVVSLSGPDQDAQGLQIDIVHPVRYLVISRADAPVRELSQLRGKTLGMARGAYYNAQVNDDAEIKKFGIVDPFQGLRMLALGRLDAVISTDYLLARALRQSRLEGVNFAPPIQVGGSAYAVYVRRDLPEALVRRLRFAMAHLHKSGRIAALLKEFD